MKKTIIAWILFVLCVIFLGTSFIIFSYLVDEEAIAKNFEQTQKEMRMESVYQKVDDLPTSVLDNFTDSLMLLTAAYQGNEETLEKAMANYRENESGEDPYETIIGSMQPTKLVQTSYARYWHGYLIFLKPLLAIMSYSKIRIFNAFLQSILFISVLILLWKRKLGYLIIPFLSAYVLINPLTIMHSLQYSSVWYLVLGSMLMYLFFQEKIIEKHLHIFLFTGVGMLTSFFDLLTYPIATLGMLLILVIAAENLDWKEAVKRILFYGCFWTLGYGIMWASKWVLASLVLKQNIFANANEAIVSRSSDVLNSGMKFSRMETFGRVFSRMDHWLTKWVIRINLFILIGKFAFIQLKEKRMQRVVYHKVDDLPTSRLGKKNRKIGKKKEKNPFRKMILNQIPLLLLAGIPLVWFLVMANHSYVHSFFTFRTTVVFWFAIFATVAKVMKEWELAKKEGIL